MLKVFAYFSTVALLLGGYQAKASFSVSTPAKLQSIDYSARTHIIISSRGADLFELPMQASLAKALRIQEVYPNEQVIVYNVTTADSKGRGINAPAIFHSFPQVHVLANYPNAVLSGSAMLKEMLKYSQIASLNHFGHSGIDAGAFMDGVGEADTMYAMQPFLPGIGQLKSHFTDDSYAIFHGCNGGHLMAIEMSRVWQIPVAGGFTTAHFEQPFTHVPSQKEPVTFGTPQIGSYYWSNDTVAQLHAQVQKTRMKSDDVAYINGFYGTYMQALPFFKFFCPTNAVPSNSNTISDERCAVGMAMSVTTTVTPVERQAGEALADFYGRVVREWLCPSGMLEGKQTLGIQTQCMAYLASLPKEKNELTPFQAHYMPFRSPGSLQCTFTGCYPESCMTSASAMDNCAKMIVHTTVGVSFKTKTELFPQGQPEGATTFVDEYYSLIDALNQLPQEAQTDFSANNDLDTPIPSPLVAPAVSVPTSPAVTATVPLSIAPSVPVPTASAVNAPVPIVTSPSHAQSTINP